MSDPIARRSLRRIIVALDASRHSEAALEAAARLCTVFDAELCGVFVVDANVLRAAELPFTLDVGRLMRTSIELSGYSVQRLFRAQENRARRAFEWTVRQHRLRNEFRVVSGDVAGQLIEAAEEADLITLGQSGSVAASRQKLGTVTRTVLSRAAGPVLVLRRGLRLDLPIVTVYDVTNDDRDEAVAIAAELARLHRDSPLVILLAGVRHAEADAVRTEVEERLSHFGHPPRFERLPGLLPEFVLERTHRYRAGLLVVPAGGQGNDYARLRRLVANADVPVMIVRSMRARSHD